MNVTVLLPSVLRHVSDADLREVDFELHRLLTLPRGRHELNRSLWGFSSLADSFESAVAGEEVVRGLQGWTLSRSGRSKEVEGRAPSPARELRVAAPREPIAGSFEALSLDDDDGAMVDTFR